MDMLNKLSTLFQQALETREPSVDLLESFVEHWKGITNYYLQNNDDSQPAKQTDIPWRLRQMLDILVYEEKQQPNIADLQAHTGTQLSINQEAVEETGVCMEYLLQHKLLETLCTLGKAQYPPGMNQQVLLFFSRLLAQIQKPLLHLINVHRPVQKLIGLCGLPASKHEKEESQFLLVVCSRVKQDPYVLKYILQILDKSMPADQSHGGTEASNQSENPVSPPSSPAQSDCCVSSSCSPTPPPGRSGLLQALVQLTGSQNGRVCLKAYESLLLLASLQAEGSGETLAHRTQLTALLAGRLCQLYSLLPLDTLDVLNLHNWPHTHWSSQFAQSCPEECLVFPGSDHMTSFFSWLDFLDHLMKEAPQVLAVKLAQAVHQYWLSGVFASHLTHMCEQRVLVSTVLLRCVLRQVQSPALLDQLVLFLLGAPRAQPEEPGTHAHSLLRRGSTAHTQPKEGGTRTHCLRYHVIQNCDHISDEISMVTLGVFEELLLKPHRDILTNLLLRNLEQRRYITAPPAVVEENHSAEDNDLSSFLDEDPFFSDDSFLPAPPEGQTQQAEGHTQDADIVNSFLCLVPVEVKSACLVQGAAYDTYIHDAHRMFQECLTVSESWAWQTSLPLSSSSSSSSDEETSFYEGHFLKVLLDRLARLLEQPYELNLQLTSLLSRLASFNHPVLHEYLLDPYITLTPGARSLFSVLIRVIGELMDRVQHVSNLTDRLANVRKQLMGLESNRAGEEFDTLLKGVIVLEEFCKELAAIAFVRIPADQD